MAPIFEELLHRQLSEVHIEVHHNLTLQERIEAYVTLQDSEKTRRVLTSPFNFMPFYSDVFLPDYPGNIVYLDTDVVILGDILELVQTDLKGHPTAAVPYCQQEMGDYIDFEELKKKGIEGYNSKACIINRGIMVIDLQSWKGKNVTDKIEWWMGKYATNKKPLWVSGMSQPPWMLALNGDYLKLGEEWNCMSLGRHQMSREESWELKKSGFDHEALKLLKVKNLAGGSTFTADTPIAPFVSTCSKRSKLLHFNGQVKPWLIDSLPEETVLPICVLPDNFPSSRWSWSQWLQIRCQGMRFVHCADVWSAYITEDTSCALKDFDKEWREEEQQWEDHKLEQERQRANAKMEALLLQSAMDKLRQEFDDMQRRQAMGVKVDSRHHIS